MMSASRAGTAETRDGSGTPDYLSLLAHDVLPGESPLAEILRLSAEARFSFAGGLPAPKTFPKIGPLIESAVQQYGQEIILQYGRSDGFSALREAAVPWLQSMTVDVQKPQDVLVTSGSQSALSIAARVLLEQPGELVALESPTYLGALDAFGERHPRYVIVNSTEKGMDPDSLDRVLSENKVKFVYTVPDFKNPDGTTIPYENRLAIARTLQKYGALLIEDGPYRQLRFEGKHIPTIQSLAPDNVILMTTLSKLLAPGLRIGLTVAPREVAERMVSVNGQRHLCPSTLDQAIAAVYIRSGALERHVPEIIDVYRPRRNAMVTALKAHFPPGWQWVVPQGGMFIWPWGPEGVDTRKVFKRALERGVAFVPGDLFLPEPVINSAMRLNFSLANEAKIDEGIGILGEVLTELGQQDK